MSQAHSDARSKRPTRMLTPVPGRATGKLQQRGATAYVQVLFAAMLLVGLLAMAVAVWFAFFSVLPGSDPGFSPEQSALLRAEQTRDAQQAELGRLRQELERLNQELTALRAQPTVAPPTQVPRLSTSAWQEPPLALILNAPIYRQQRSLSCESSAAAMAANYYGLAISEQTILAALPLHENPHLGFRGNVDGPHGGLDDYGVYAEPLQQVLQEFGLDVERLSGGTAEIREHIRRGRVVIAWVTYDLQVQVPSQVTLGNGQIVTLVPFEHTVLVVGYNGDGLWVNDPYSGTQVFYLEGDFVRSFSYLKNMALVVGPPLTG